MTTSNRKNKQTTGKPATTSINGAKLPTFVSCELSQEEKDSLKSSILSPEEIIDLLDTMQSEGYRVAISHDSRSDCVGIYVTAVDADHENAGLALSSRGPNLSAAATVLSFKHYHKLGEDWRSGLSSESRDSWG